MTTLPFAGLLRQELDAHVAALGRRRLATPTVYVGAPGGESVQVAATDLPGRHLGWRADLLERALDGLEAPYCAWITRSGTLEPTDDDRAWCAAARVAFARHGIDLPAFPVLCRSGWTDLLTGGSVSFYRIRKR